MRGKKTISLTCIASLITHPPIALIPPPLLACPFSQPTSQGTHGACVVTGLLGLCCSPYFCSASVIIIIKLSPHALAPPPPVRPIGQTNSENSCHCLPCVIRRGGGSNTTKPVRADDERQRQEDNQRHRQTGGRHCCAQTEQQKLTYKQKGIAGCARFH